MVHVLTFSRQHKFLVLVGMGGDPFLPHRVYKGSATQNIYREMTVTSMKGSLSKVLKSNL